MLKALRSSWPWPRGAGLAAALALAALCLAEFVRTGLYAAFLVQYGQREAGLTLTAVGLAWSVHYGADTLGRSLGGHLAGRYGLRPVALVAALVGLAATVVALFVRSPWLLIPLAAVHGLSFSGLWPGVMTTATRLAGPERQAQAVGFVTLAVAPFVGVAFLGLGALSAAGIAVAGAPLAWWLLVGVSAAVLVVSVLAPWPSGGTTAPVPSPAAAEDVRAELAPSLRRSLALLLPGAVVQTLALALLGPLVTNFADRVGLGTLGLAAVLGLGGLAAYGLLPVAGRLAARRGSHLVLSAGLVIAALGFAVLATLPPVWAYFPLALVVGGGYASLVTGWGGLVSGLLPERDRAAIWGLIMTAENMGTAGGPLIGSFAAQHFGLTAPFVLGAGLLFAAGLLYLFGFRGQGRPRPGKTGAAEGGPPV